MQGTVTRLLSDRGFGFIAADGQEYFFNVHALQGVDFGELAEGTDVVFDVDEHPVGDRPGERPRAVSIRLADDAVPAADHELLPREKTV